MTNLIRILGHFIKTDFGIALGITLVWKLLYLLFGFGVDVVNGGATSFLDHTFHWDAGWYMSIIYDHYLNIPASAAFYPLFPFLVSIVSLFGTIDYLIAGQIVNTVTLWLGLTALIKLSRHFLGEKQRFWILLLVLSAPAAAFFHFFYGESLFLALSAWAYVFALRRQWIFVGILLGLLTATRLPSLLIIALCGLEFLRTYNWNIKKIFNKNLLFFLIAPIGFLTYGTYLYLTTGNFLGMFSAYEATDDWIYQVFNPNIIETMAKAAYQIVRSFIGLRPLDSELFINYVLPLASIAVLGLSSLYVILKHRKNLLPLGITGLLAIVMFTLNSNVVSVHRYVLPMIVIPIAIGLLLSKLKHRKILFALICATGIICQIIVAIMFINVKFAG